MDGIVMRVSRLHRTEAVSTRSLLRRWAHRADQGGLVAVARTRRMESGSSSTRGARPFRASPLAIGHSRELPGQDLRSKPAQGDVECPSTVTELVVRL